MATLTTVFSTHLISTAQTNSQLMTPMTINQLLAELENISTTILEPSAVIQQEFDQLRSSHGIADTDDMYRQFVRVRLAFEATRDSGLWQIKWAVTNREPNSDQIWQQWRTHNEPSYQDLASAQPTAIAECDELSALFAVIARGLGVKSVGLFWPTHNHTVAVWTAQGKDGSAVRVVVPTSQIFLSAKAGLGTTEFDPDTQKNIYNYTRRDIALESTLPGELADMMINQVKNLGHLPAAELQTRRNRLSRMIGGS